jgi:hypothetical protein
MLKSVVYTASFTVSLFILGIEEMALVSWVVHKRFEQPL